VRRVRRPARLVRPGIVAVSVLTIVASHGVLHGRAAAADVNGAGTAAADGMRVEADDPGFTPLGAKGEMTFPAAQAAVSGAGSTAYASAPYPGEAAVAAPGLVASQTGAPAPPYPFYVSSTYPTTPDQSLDTGVFTLAANSTERTSAARGSGGGSAGEQAAGRTAATAKVTVDASGTVTAEGSGTAESVNLGDALHIGRVVSNAKAVRDATGHLERTSVLEIEGATVAGQPVKITPSGVQVANTTNPLPANPLGNVLADHGITITYLAEKDTDDGVVSPGLVVTVVEDTPQKVAGSPTTTYTFGLSSAFASSDGPVSDTGTAAVIGSDVTGGVDDGSGAGGVGASGPGADVAAAVPAPVGGTHSGRLDGLAATPASGRRPEAPDYPTYTFYLALVVAAGASFGSGQLLRLLGVRR